MHRITQGLVVGVVEPPLGNAQFAERVPGVAVVVHTSFAPRLRASVIGLGFVLLLAWGPSGVGGAIVASRGTRR